jgi:predicted small secreted protein
LGRAAALFGAGDGTSGPLRASVLVWPRRDVLPGAKFEDIRMKKLLVVLALSSGLLVSACNTIHGAARDVQSVGDCADGRKGNC